MEVQDNTVYVFRSTIGDFVIKYIPSSKKWLLSVNDTGYGLFPSAAEAADSVNRQKSGFYKWDELEQISETVPCGIDQWEVFNP